MERIEGLELIYVTWRQKLMRTVTWLAIFVVAVEIGFSCFLYFKNLIDETLPVYVVLYLIVPAFINFMSIGIGYYLLQSPKVSHRIKNHTPGVVLFIICSVVLMVHNTFAATSATFAIPVMITVIFGNRKVTSYMSGLCGLSIFAGLLLSIQEDRFSSSDYSINYVVGCAVFLGTCIVAPTLISYEKKIRNSLQDNILQKKLLQHQIKRDALTGLYNHTTFYKKLKKIQIECLVKEVPMSLAVIDIDNFKEVNDIYGHDRGNVVILALSNLLLQENKEGAISARYGGEEFAVIFPGMDVVQAAERMNQMLSFFNKIKHKGLYETQVSFSCGVAQLDPNCPEKDLFDMADRAMYQAKANGRNQVIIAKE